VLIFGGAAVLAVGSLLPWVKASAGIFTASVLASLEASDLVDGTLVEEQGRG